MRITVSDPSRAGRAAAVLGPLNPGRLGDALLVDVNRAGGASTLRKLLGRVDAEGIDASVELAATTQVPEIVAALRRTFVADWDAETAALPDDWSDVYGEVELESSDQISRAALLLAPCNPARADVRALRFRAARRNGYGTSATMVRRCLERLDEDGIRGGVRILRALSDTDHVHTQGPVWYVGGKAV